MAVFIILLVSLLLFRGLGIWGENSWVSAVRYGIATMLLFTASAHLTSRKKGLIAIVPLWLRAPMQLLFIALTWWCTR